MDLAARVRVALNIEKRFLLTLRLAQQIRNDLAKSFGRIAAQAFFSRGRQMFV